MWVGGKMERGDAWWRRKLRKRANGK